MMTTHFTAAETQKRHIDVFVCKPKNTPSESVTGLLSSDWRFKAGVLLFLKGSHPNRKWFLLSTAAKCC